MGLVATRNKAVRLVPKRRMAFGKVTDAPS